MTIIKKSQGRVIVIQRAYAKAGPADGYRVLVDHFWPRGRSKVDLNLAVWAREIAPTSELIRWFGHKPERWEEFQERYRAELAKPEMQKRLRALLADADSKKITLVYGARNETENQAIVLREVLQSMDGD